MATRIDYLPEWFDLTNYLRFEDMSEVELLKELKLRMDIMNSIVVQAEYGQQWIYEYESGMWAAIRKGKPSLTTNRIELDSILKSQDRTLLDSGDSDTLKYKAAREKLDRFHCSFESNVVRLIEVIDIEFMNDVISEYRENLDIDAKKDHYEATIFCDITIDKLNDDLKSHFDHGMLHLKIDLKNLKNNLLRLDSKPAIHTLIVHT